MQRHAAEDRLIDSLLPSKNLLRAALPRLRQRALALRLRIAAREGSAFEVRGRRNQNRDGVGIGDHKLRAFRMNAAACGQNERFAGKADLVLVLRPFAQHERILPARCGH